MHNERSLVPPHNYQAEMAVLGSVLIDKEAIIKIADTVAPEDFYRASHGQIYDAILALYAKNEPIDLLSVSNRLAERQQFEGVGGHTYLAQLAESVPTSSHAHHYAEIVRKLATLRRLLETSQNIQRMSFDCVEEEVDQVLDKAEQKLFAVSQKFLKKNFVPIRTVLDEAFERIDELHKEKGALRGISTGFTQLDNLLGGLQRADLVVLAARPSVGKTSFALDIARGVAVRSKLPVGIFSLEMSKEQLVDRMISSEANVDLWRMRTGKLSDGPGNSDFPRIGNALGILSEAPIFIDDSANVNIMEIRTKARRLAKDAGGELGLIVVDYLQLMESKTSIENRVQEVAAITRSLKGIARELNVPVLALSQLSRAVEQNKPAIPKLAHLRESGSIEQDADVVMFIYRKAADRNYRQEDLAPEERHVAEIHVAKHRNGPTGTVRMFFDENRASFRNLETKMAGAPLPAAQQR